jgi:hypothetical protein
MLIGARRRDADIFTNFPRLIHLNFNLNYSTIWSNNFNLTLELAFVYILIGDIDSIEKKA